MAPPVRPERPNPITALPRRPRRAASIQTQERILDSAEALYIETGFASTSLRAIATRAGVNLAAAHYHFGSKEGLIVAAVERRVGPANEARLLGLEALQARNDANDAPTVEEILKVYFAPLAERGVGSTLSRLVARLFCEPESISKRMLERVFGPSFERYVEALAEALPDLSVDEVRWRFHFVIGSMIQLLNFGRPLGMPASPSAVREGLPQLLHFAVAGMRQGVAESGEEPR